MRAVMQEAWELVKERFLLEEDANSLIRSAETSNVLRDAAEANQPEGSDTSAEMLP